MTQSNFLISSVSPFVLVTLCWSVVSFRESVLALSPPEQLSHQAMDLLPINSSQLSPLSLPETPEFPSEANPQPLETEDLETELGNIEVIVTTPAPSLQLLFRSSLFTNSNIFASDRLLGDTVFINSGLLLATPQLSNETRLIAGVEAGLIRYLDQAESHAHFANFTVNLEQKLSPEMFAQLGWVQARIYHTPDENRLLLDDSVRLLVGRQDALSPNSYLDSVYELRASFSSPPSESRVINRFATRFRYDLTSQLQGILDYQLTLKSYTETDRFDHQHQLGAGLFYYPTADLLLSASVAYVFGSSSQAGIDLNNFSIGLGLLLRLPLF